jgi:hypothetical protein
MAKTNIKKPGSLVITANDEDKVGAQLTLQLLQQWL